MCFGDPCAQNLYIERLFWEIIMLIGSLVELYVGLHSCPCFSPLEKLFWKAGWHLLNTLLSVELLKSFSYRNPDSSSIPGGSIEKSPASSIASRHLVDRSSLSSCVFALFLDNFICRRCFSRHLPWQMSRHLSINWDILACISFFFVLHFFFLYVHSTLFFFFL